MGLHLLFGLFLLTFLGQPCDRVFDLGHSPCVFYVNENNSSCASFIFDKCEWEECISYYSINGTTYCGRYQTFSNGGWEFCTKKCCDSSVNYPQTYQSISQCQDYLDGQFKLIMTIIGSILAGGLLIGIIIFACKTEKCGSCGEKIVNCLVDFLCCKCFRSSEVGVIQQNQQREADIQCAQISKVPKKENLEVKWMRLTEKKSQKKDLCSVCLEGNPSLQLQCSHIYHRKCIINWLRRKMECSLCRSTEIDSVKVYCEECFNSYYETKLMPNMSPLQSNLQICSTCSGANN